MAVRDDAQAVAVRPDRSRVGIPPKRWPSRGALLRMRHPSWQRVGFPRLGEASHAPGAEARSQAGGATASLPAERGVTTEVVVSESTLSERLVAHLASLGGAVEALVTCEFLPGGKKFGVGIPSALYCMTCGHARILHDIAQAAAIVEAEETAARTPLLASLSDPPTRGSSQEQSAS